MRRAFKIPTVALFAIVGGLVLGELMSGTDIYFVTMMMITMLSIGFTYNYLGGISTMSGLLFTAFALRTIVISQFAKVILFEAADKNLEVPQLTISVYAVFFVSAMVGVYLFGKMRLRLPRPAEPETTDQSRILYTISLVIGLVATFVFESYSQAYGTQTVYNGARNIAVALDPLLLLAFVVAVDDRIRVTDGRHSFSFAALIPWIAATVVGFADTVRTQMMMPTIIYVLMCYLRGYKFRFRHYAVILFGGALFFYFLGPFLLYARIFTEDQTFQNRIYIAFHVLEAHHDPREIRAIETVANESSNEQYFSAPGTFLISRLSLIRADSDVIDACSGGFHYGFNAILIEAEWSVPSILYKNKPRDTSGQDYIGRVSGMSGDVEGDTHPQISAVSDSYGAFGWLGVVLFPLLGFPAVFVVYESMFDESQPWGTVAFGTCFFIFGEMMVIRFIPLVLRDTTVILVLSRVIGGFVRTIPTRGDRPVLLEPREYGH